MKRRLIVSAVLGALVSLFAIQVVFAHSRPVRLEPAPGALLSVAPSQVTGWFTSTIRRDQNWSFLRVTDEQGNRVDAGETTLSTDRKQMTVNLRSGLADGRYLVTWRTWDDADGEIFGDCYYFFVGQAAADAQLSSNTRLDGGSSCERAEVAAASGTPTPGSSLTPALGDDHADDEPNEGGDGLPLWVTVLGVFGGVAVGLVGSRFLGASR